MKYALPLIILIIATGLLFTKDPQRQGDSRVANVASLETQVEPDSPPSITYSPQEVIQGNPVLVKVEGVELGEIQSLTFNGKRLNFFNYQGKPSALIGVDLRMQTGGYPLVLTLDSGERIAKDIQVQPRAVVSAPFDIPEKLGGNTSEAQQTLINTLVQEGAIITAIPTSLEKLWEEEFRLPIDPPITITDIYGYTRITVGTTVSHKGTDFRAEIGTPVYAINSGLVRYVGFLRNYGNTIVIDHGFGLHSIYMHLSEVSVSEGETVESGRTIGASGDTGYVLGPHLHLSIKLDKISIDPMKFFEVFGVN